MTNLKLNIAAIIFAIFALTSCQKENLSELQTTAKTTTTTSSNSDRDVPAAGVHIVNQAVKTQASKATFEKQAQSRSRALYGVECGSTFAASTVGEGSTLDASRYPSCIREAVGDSFEGDDMIFHFSVEETPEAIVTHDISISGLTADLDLFLFSLDRFGFINECKALSITIGLDDEKISVSDLSPGCYIIMVDGYAAGVAGDFTFEMACSAVSANPPSISITDINMVTAGPENTKTTTFRQMNATDWKETGEDGAEFDFVETSRDESIVYLRDESRGVELQLDMNRKVIVYSEDDGVTFDLYNILDSNNKMNGYLTTAVVVGLDNVALANFTQTGDVAWTETSNNPEVNDYEFTETARDEWSVYLRDDSRGVNIQLDMNRMMVVYSDDNGNAFDLYDIMSAN